MFRFVTLNIAYGVIVFLRFSLFIFFDLSRTPLVLLSYSSYTSLYLSQLSQNVTAKMAKFLNSLK